MQRTRIGKADQNSQIRRNGARAAANTQVSRIQKLQQTFGNRALQRLLDAAAPDESEEFASSLEQYSGSGNPLPGQARLFLEQQLGVDLSPVRIHTGQEAHELSTAVAATAFTTGTDIFFKHGSYNPDSAQGMHLLAHETSHVVQQSEGSGEVDGQPLGGTAVKVSDPSDRFEQAAEQTADQVMSGALIGGLAEQSLGPVEGTSLVGGIAVSDPSDRFEQPAERTAEWAMASSSKGRMNPVATPISAVGAPSVSVQRDVDETDHDAEIQKQIAERRAARDARVDEYGIEKPPATFAETFMDDVAPKEILNDTATPWYETIGRAAAAAPAGIAGWYLDQLSPLDTRGDPRLPVVGEWQHASELNEYSKKRQEYEEQARAGQEQAPADQEQAPADGEQSDAEEEDQRQQMQEDTQSCMDFDSGGVCLDENKY